MGTAAPAYLRDHTAAVLRAGMVYVCIPSTLDHAWQNLDPRECGNAVARRVEREMYIALDLDDEKEEKTNKPTTQRSDSR